MQHHLPATSKMIPAGHEPVFLCQEQTMQLEIFPESEILNRSYMTIIGCLAKAVELPYRKDVFQLIRGCTSDRYLSAGEICEKVPPSLRLGLERMDVIARHIDALRDDGLLTEMQCYFGAESPAPGQTYRGFKSYYRWRNSG